MVRFFRRRSETSTVVVVVFVVVVAIAIVILWLVAASPALGQDALGKKESSTLAPRASESLLLDIVNVDGRLVAAGDYGHILYSDDAGQTWQQAEVPTRRMLTAVHFPSPERGWAVGHDGLILATIDGGARWSIQRDGLADQETLNREAVTTAKAALETGQQALLAAQSLEERQQLQADLETLEFDLEDALEIAGESIHTPPLLDVYFTDELHGVAAGAFNTLLVTRDGGVNWTLLPTALDNPDEYHLNAVTGDGKGKLWIAAEGGLLFRSENAGQQWQTLQSPYRGSWFGIVNAPDSSALLAFGLRGNVYRSEDGGDAWTRVTTEAQRTLSGGHFINSQFLLVTGTVGALLASDDGGITFTGINSGTRLNLSAVAITGDKAVLVGQGGVHLADPFAGDNP